MDWRMDDWGLLSRVSPFRYLRLTGYLLLPAAFRSLSRLSSALGAKASTLRSFLLNFFLHSYVALYECSNESWRIKPATWWVLLSCMSLSWLPILIWIISISAKFASIFRSLGYVWCLVNNKWLIIISLYEVLKVHVTRVSAMTIQKAVAYL